MTRRAILARPSSPHSMRNLASLSLLILGCTPSPTAPAASPPTGTARPDAEPAPPPAASVSSSPEPAPKTPAPLPAGCSAPSLALRGPADARHAGALDACQFRPTGHDDIGSRCGQPGHEHEVTLDRLDRAVPPLSPKTAEHVRAIAATGRDQDRDPRAFGLIGDSITASPKFMKPLSAATHTALAPEVAARLTVGAGRTIVDVYRGHEVTTGLDSYLAPRAAKVGAKSSWVLRGKPSPLDRLIADVSPAVAIVMYGSNDAAVRYGDLDELVAAYRERMSRIVDRLEQAGIVPILNTVPRHTLDPSRPNCDRKPGDGSNWRMAVQTSALSAAAAQLACERALPLIDLRWAFDAILNHGIGPDGVHPNAHRGGSAKLDAEGLQCGYNVRNYVTLRMLARVWPLVTPREPPNSYP